MSEAAWPAAVSNLLKWEGGYVNDPSDPGGETNWGISKRSYPDLNIKSLTQENAKAIYHRDWWLPYHLGEMPDAIGVKVLDIIVNLGPRQGFKLVQRACNRLLLSPPYLIEDGTSGPLTRAAVIHADPIRLLAMLREVQANYYTTLATEHPVMRKFLHGWLRRAAS